VAFRERIPLFTHIPLLRAQQKKWHSRKEYLFFTHTSLEGSTKKVAFRERIPLFTRIPPSTIEGSTEKLAFWSKEYRDFHCFISFLD
jgi:hypothetical protein